LPATGVEHVEKLLRVGEDADADELIGVLLGAPALDETNANGLRSRRCRQCLDDLVDRHTRVENEATGPDPCIGVAEPDTKLEVGG